MKTNMAVFLGISMLIAFRYILITSPILQAGWHELGEFERKEKNGSVLVFKIL